MAPTQLPVSIDDVLEARKLLDGVVRRTPLETSRPLSERSAARSYLKCENLQRAGSFKIRGAYIRIARLVRRGAGRAASSRPAPATTPRASRSRPRCSASRPRSSCRRARRCPRSTATRGVRRRGRARSGTPSTSAWSRRRRYAARDRRGADPPVRPPRHRGRAGHGRAGDPRAVPGRAHGRGGHRRRRAARRHRGRGQGACDPTSGSSASRPSGPRRTRRRSRAGHPVALDADGHDGRRDRGRLPGRGAVRHRVRDCVDEVVTVSEEIALARPAAPAGAGQAGRRAGRCGQRRGAAGRRPHAVRAAGRSRCCPAATSTRCCMLRVLRHGMAAAGRYLQFRVRIAGPAGGAVRAAGRCWPRPTPTSLEVEHVRTDATPRLGRGRGRRPARDQGRRALRAGRPADACASAGYPAGARADDSRGLTARARYCRRASARIDRS